MSTSFSLFFSVARTVVRRALVALTSGCLLAGAVHAQTSVEVLQVQRIPVTQVVVGGDDGRPYRMVTLQQLESDVVMVDAGMVWSAQPFSVVHDRLQPITSLEQMDAILPLQTMAPVSTGLKEVHSFYSNILYEVTYRQGDAHWVVETTQPPEAGRLLLTAEMHPRKLPS